MAQRRRIDADHPGYDPGSCDADGRAQCRRCLAALPHPHAEFCGAACRHEHRMRSSPAYARRAVYARDRGVCTHCRIDCGLIDRVVARLVRGLPEIDDREPTMDADGDRLGDEDVDDLAAAEQGAATALWLIAALGFGARTRVCSLWQADHRQPFSDGGADCGMGNFRTLCLACHQAQTRELHRRQAAARRA